MRPSTSNQRGFTLIELMIVVAAIAIVAAIAVPNLWAAKIQANEGVAISLLRNVMTAQATIRSMQEIDGDVNGVGEFGYFAELSAVRNTHLDEKGKGTDGESDMRASGALSTAFGDLDSKGLLRRSGYLFRMALPGKDFSWQWEKPLEKRYPRLSPTYAETYWGLYAWPITFGSSGRRAFFVNQMGQITTCQNQQTRYSGSGNMPKGGAALIPTGGGGAKGAKGAKDRMDTEMAVNAIGGDGNLWKVTR